MWSSTRYAMRHTTNQEDRDLAWGHVMANIEFLREWGFLVHREPCRNLTLTRERFKRSITATDRCETEQNYIQTYFRDLIHKEFGPIVAQCHHCDRQLRDEDETFIWYLAHLFVQQFLTGPELFSEFVSTHRMHTACYELYEGLEI